MELKGFGAFNDPKGNIKIASKFALAKEINKGWFDLLAPCPSWRR